MKRKELKNLAIKIAKQEQILQKENIGLDEKESAEKEIMRLCGKVTNMNDMIDLDDYVQKIIRENEMV